MKIQTFELSGFGGEYEEAVQKMMWRGVEWLQKNGNPEFTSLQSENVIGVAINEGDTGKEFDRVITKEVEGCTGAMHQCATNHARYIAKNGYQNWFKLLSSTSREEDSQPFEFEFDGEIDLTKKREDMRYFLTVYRYPDGSLRSSHLMANETIPKAVGADGFDCESKLQLFHDVLLKLFPFMENIPEGDLVELSIKPISQICKTVTYTENPFEGEI